MKTYIFLGPSLDLNEAQSIYPDAIYLPPVKCGGVVKVLQNKPDRLVIIDGFFHYVASVWHKEILFALSKGVEVHGASSMGALRAAELYQFGMVGHGKVYESYKSGELTDDDEVAVLHRSEKSGYKPITDAMVNIRSTLNAAAEEKYDYSSYKNENDRNFEE